MRSSKKNVDQLYKYYLHDFVRYVHKSNLNIKLCEMENQVNI